MFALSSSLLSSIYKEIGFAIGAFFSPLLLTMDLLIEFPNDRMINTKQLARNV